MLDVWRVSVLQIEVDVDDVLGRQFSALEKKNLDFAIVQASNKVAFEVRESWKRAAGRIFDRPTPRTLNAALYSKATKQKPYAEIFLHDAASKGASPAKYLRAQVEGGDRRPKGMESLLMSAGLMPRDGSAVPGNDAPRDQYGNVGSGQVRKILSQLRAGQDAGKTANETDEGRGRRLKRQRKRGGGGSFFLVQKQRGRLRPGIYERIGSGQGGAVRAMFIFSRKAVYDARYDIFGIAAKEWNTLMPFYFERELANAVETSVLRGRG